MLVHPSFALKHGEIIFSDISKRVTKDYLVNFELLKDEVVKSYLDRFFDLSECNPENIEEFKYLASCPRFAARFIMEIIRLEKKCKEDTSKQYVPKKAIEETVKAVSDQLESSLCRIVD